MAKKLNIREIFDRQDALRQERLELEKRVKELDSEEKLLKQALIAEIPEGSVVSGVKHTVSYKATPKWGEILPLLKEKFIPKTKHGETDDLIAEHSTTSATHRFSLES